MQRFFPFRMLSRLRREQAGTAAVEFSLFAPVLCFACIATVDLGMALGERISMDHVLRAGAASAMLDEGEEEVRKVLAAAGAENFDVQVSSSTGEDSTDDASTGVTPGGGDDMTVAAERYCACPDNTGAQVDCSTTCAGSQPTYVYYLLTAGKSYSGIIIPEFDFDASMRVQAR